MVLKSVRGKPGIPEGDDFSKIETKKVNTAFADAVNAVMESPQASVEKDYLSEFVRYAVTRFQNSEHGEFSVHFGAGHSSIPVIDAVCGKRTYIFENDMDVSHSVASWKRIMDSRIDASGGCLWLTHMDRFFEKYPEVDHVTVRNVFNYIPPSRTGSSFDGYAALLEDMMSDPYYRGDAVKDCNTLLDHLKDGGTILVDTATWGKGQFSQTEFENETLEEFKKKEFELTGDKVLIQAAKRRDIKLTELDEFTLPSNYNQRAKLFRIQK
ncbi:MAG: hypothetical protein V1921_04340 [Candidatus Altiarchaeota archaeon]